MRPLVAPEEMRRADEAVISSGVPAEVLMERAGRAVARVVLRELAGRYGRRVAVVCGKGNNGGDGFVVARVLHLEGVRVVCCTTFDPDDAKGPARHHLERLLAAGCKVRRFDARHLHADVIVDAVFGTGFHGEPRGQARAALQAIEHLVRSDHVDDDTPVAIPSVPPRPRVISVDVPSARLVPSDVTVALGAEKLETFFSEADRAADVVVADIGIPVTSARVYVLEAHDIVNDLPQLRPDDHKTSHGSVVVIAGSDATTGAALLTARAAGRMGAGYVTLVSAPGVILAANVRLPEVLKKQIDGAILGPAALDAAADELERADAVALGPGLGRGDEQTALVERCLREVDKPLVLDADALNALAGNGHLIAQRDATCVVTPHVAEMARLLDVETSEVLQDRPAIALRAAEELGCVVVLKGRNTLVATPSGELSGSPGRDLAAAEHRGSSIAWAVPSGGPELATAGTGDVLTGAMVASLARGLPARRCAVMTCYVHGVAGAIAAEAMGATGVVAWDVAEALPDAVRRLRAPYAG